jgi:gliding motility-associated-like protein
MTIPLYSDQEYIVHLTTACGDTVKSDTVLISVTETGSPELSDDTTYCSGEIISEISVVDEGLVYTWYDNPELLVSIGNGASFLPFENLGTTTYYVTVIDGSCESVPDSVDITILESPELQIEESIETCSGVPIEIFAVGSGQITWAPADVLTNTNQNTTTFIGSDSIYVYVELMDAYGCVSFDSIEVNVIEQPSASFSFSPTSPTLNEPLVQFTDNSSDNVTLWSWDFGNGYSSNLENPSFVFQEVGVYTVALAVETQFGCLDSTTASIEIKPPFSYYIPNAFTPNGDGKNDSFGGEGTGINDFQIMIFNRWGEEIFYSENPEVGWDGKFKGKDVEVGAYAYILTLSDLEMNYHKFSGSVTVLR